MKWTLLLIFSVLTAILGHEIHGSLFWAFMDFLFPLIAWIKWLVLHQVNVTIIQHAFSFFFR